ncbi:two-component system, cell cycle response regulator DivK [Mucilaginibacter gossypiicola]|uniref:Two-component system, cell cycle response regulator DivK n=1 Tax=Mucilaginibacter gossypiicola TaxID=551995 RepID=A0A1H8U4S5_9SPHI|nr:response regulator [Mucilaginibacter gossypiicola]SEO98155.1 two-component system, cell cycle response regulator DivK [Mucilaginibacter gossypiicola]
MSIKPLKKILVIEDDGDIADIMGIALCDKYEVEVKRDGYEVVAQIERFAPDLILLDNYIGQRQAREIIKEIHEVDDHRTIPFVLFSGHENIIQLAENLNATSYLAKPFALDELYKCIDGILAA